ncbi:unnamed protein product [Mytilus edulis]|uniref:Ig-like domain-containing protein n=1 Tax=Mytilus edulis TaxID=6550 RepID=A0A8S3SKE3_MYTED|nr:unnamed protein product [Mytilus edulis]
MINWIPYCCLLFVYLSAEVFTESDITDVYAEEEEIMILQCHDTAIDHWENINNRSFFVFCNELKSSSRHLLTEECNLQIQVTTDDYYTTYRCVIGGNPPRFKDFKIYMPTPPSGMNVYEAISGKDVVGVEGQKMTLTCNVNSGKPTETIFWSRNGIVVSSGGPGRLLYTFVPERASSYVRRNEGDMYEREHDTYTQLLRNIRTANRKLQLGIQWCQYNRNIRCTSSNIYKQASLRKLHVHRENAAGSNHATLHLHEDKLCKSYVHYKLLRV